MSRRCCFSMREMLEDLAHWLGKRGKCMWVWRYWRTAQELNWLPSKWFYFIKMKLFNFLFSSSSLLLTELSMTENMRKLPLDLPWRESWNIGLWGTSSTLFILIWRWKVSPRLRSMIRVFSSNTDWMTGTTGTSRLPINNSYYH